MSQSLVVPEQFILATRDAGYRSTASALAELVDNAIQAQASRIEIDIAKVASGGIKIEVSDDGIGMSRRELAQCLRFGGSHRFDDRSSLGRFGMGLPNASLSQARRISVSSWRSGRGYVVTLDVDAVVRSGGASLLEPKPLPALKEARQSGTIVLWEECDRLDRRQIAALERRIRRELGQVFRSYLGKVVVVCLNGTEILPVDPLFRRAICGVGAKPFGDPLRYEVSYGKASGEVVVRFTELPLRHLSTLSDSEKRRIGIIGGAGVSVLRHQREIDFGWYFMGAKRRENYDDWWRCEVEFPPCLDEAFGVTNLKQGIRPTPSLVEQLSPNVEAVARALNGRVRQSFDELKREATMQKACRLAEGSDALLAAAGSVVRKRAYSLRVTTWRGHEAVRWRVSKTAVAVEVNKKHPLFRDLYQPMLNGNDESLSSIRTAFELVLLALARSSDLTKDSASWENYGSVASDVIATFLNGAS